MQNTCFCFVFSSYWTGYTASCCSLHTCGSTFFLLKVTVLMQHWVCSCSLHPNESHSVGRDERQESTETSNRPGNFFFFFTKALKFKNPSKIQIKHTEKRGKKNITWKNALFYYIIMESINAFIMNFNVVHFPPTKHLRAVKLLWGYEQVWKNSDKK